ncbi:hypothetical protein Tco_1242913 [Tanacetum coccineum]
MSSMLSSDATFSMEMFPFGHCPEGNGDVSSVCFVREDNNNNNKEEKTNEYRDDELDNVKTDGEQSHDEVYGFLKGGSGNSRGKRLSISMVEETWSSEKEDV